MNIKRQGMNYFSHFPIRPDVEGHHVFEIETPDGESPFHPGFNPVDFGIVAVRLDFR
jgi:hypothetical protein